MHEFTPHSPMQEEAIFFKTPLGVLACGIQFGKTKAGSVWMKLQNHRFTDPTDNFLIVAPTYKILSQSTLPPYLDMMREYGTFSKSDMTFKINGGGTVYCRTGTDPDSIVGITNIRAIWGDEAGLFTLYFAENIAARAAFRAAQTLYTTSPYTLNWLYRQIILPKMRRGSKERPDVTLIQAASWDNPYFPKEVIERNRLTMDPRRFNALFGGQWERMAGLVYDCFDEVENQCDAFTLPVGTKYFGGIDWGYTEPFVFKIRAVTPAGQHYGIFEHYKAGHTIMDIETVLLRVCQTFPVKTIYCGRDQPGYIEHLNRAFGRAKLQAHCVGADNDVRVGIDRHYQLLKARRLKYFRGANPYTLDELDTYHYPEPSDLKPDENVKDEGPVQQNDHALDADRYLSIMTFRAHERTQPIVPEEKKAESQHQRIERLKRRPRAGGSERWSA